MIHTLFLILPVLQVKSFTEPVEFDADDPAVAYNQKQPEKTLILGTDKEKAPGGGLYVFNLKGKIVHSIKGLDRPNNVDVIQNFDAGGSTISVAVVTERLQNRLRLFQVSEDGALTDLTGDTEVFTGSTGEDKAPMGVACYNDQVFVTPKLGSLSNHVEVLDLVWNRKTKKIDASSKSRFGNFTGKKETESIAIDAREERVFYSDELKGIWCYSLQNLKSPFRFLINPKHVGDHEGLAFTEKYLVSTDQRENSTVFWLYDRKTLRLAKGLQSNLDSTDGIEIITKPLGNEFPRGLMIAMNSKAKNFALIDLRQLDR